jgi:hypothetical protein
MTTHQLHQVLMLGISQCIIVCPNFQVNHYTESESRASIAFLEATEDAVMFLASLPET